MKTIKIVLIYMFIGCFWGCKSKPKTIDINLECKQHVPISVTINRISAERYLITLNANSLTTKFDFVLNKEAILKSYDRGFDNKHISSEYLSVSLLKNQQQKYQLKLIWSNYKRFKGVVFYDKEIELEKQIIIQK